MNILTSLDWFIVGGFFLISLVIGLLNAKRSGENLQEFFLSGRNMPWWLLGISMVATTFSADTPNLVTDLVRKEGVAGNWKWWAYLLTGMLTVFVYAKLWRRSGVLTDLSFYELRYSGPAARWLRLMRAIYLGVFFNIMVMATVCLAAIKIGGAMLGLEPVHTLLIAGTVTVIYSALGGLRGIIWVDLFQFILAMFGTIAAAYYIINLPQVGGLDGFIEKIGSTPKANILPDATDRDALWTLLILPLAVQWWASYYPGGEPGGGGYVVQRMLAAKNEKHAMGAALLFNVAHYAIRPWPWILIALASLIIYPDLLSLQNAMPEVSPSIINDDLAYPAMMRLLPAGLIGIVFASLAAAFMSTISTHLNWGSSYLIHDVYKTFMNNDASEKELVGLSRIITIILMIIAAIVALYLDNAKQIFDAIILVGAGTGLIYILRWFWWRINAYSEMTAMVVSAIIAYVVSQRDDLSQGDALFITVGVTTVAWLTVTFLTRPTDDHILRSFYSKIRPYALGWKPYAKGISAKGTIGAELVAALSGSIMVFGMLFSLGQLLYKRWDVLPAMALLTFLAGIITWAVGQKVWGENN